MKPRRRTRGGLFTAEVAENAERRLPKKKNGLFFFFNLSRLCVLRGGIPAAPEFEMTTVAEPGYPVCDWRRQLAPPGATVR
jgi:hypothetical protein